MYVKLDFGVLAHKSRKRVGQPIGDGNDTNKRDISPRPNLLEIDASVADSPLNSS